MPKTLVNCPQCKQPIQAELTQLFDVGKDPTSKQRLLSGAFNIVQCPYCGYQGNYASPIVYHDPQKELLITFVPPEVGLPKNEQERIIGSMINQVMSNLPQEQRKAYLLQPQASLTLQGLVEQILEADGITKEMIQANQQRMNLIQRLINATEDVKAEIVRQEDKNIDSEFFGILDRLIQSNVVTGDENVGVRLTELQKYLLSETTFGKELSSQLQEIEAAVQSLRDAGKELTREKLLDLVIKAPNDIRLEALVSLARPGMDYVFFQQLSEKIDRARTDGRTRLVELREKLLQMIDAIDERVAVQVKQARELLSTILGSEKLEEAVMQNLPAIDEFFLQELNRSLEQANKDGDQDKLVKLQQISKAISQASQASQAIQFIEALLKAQDETSRKKLLEENKEQITPEFLNTLSNIVYQVQSGEDLELSAQFKELHRQVLHFSMEKNLNAS
jgi:hypothetical protein